MLRKKIEIKRKEVKQALIGLLIILAGACGAADSTYRIRIEKGGNIVSGTACAIGEHRLVVAAHALSGCTEICVEQEIGWLRCKVVKADPEMDLAVLDCRAADFAFAKIDAQPKDEIVIESSIKAEVVEMPAPKQEAVKKPVDDQKPATSHVSVKDDVTADSEVEVNGVQKIDSTGYVLVEFGATWCGGCKKNVSNIEALEKNKGEFAGVYSIDVDANQDLATERKVNTIPCQIVYYNGKEVGRHTGVHTREEMLAWIKQSKAR